MHPITNYEDLYSITVDGKIFSHPKEGSGGHKGHWLSPDTKPNGYQTVTLTKDKKTQRFLIHRLVALTFIANPENKEFVNHRNGIKTDNSVSNLEWVTAAENEQHSYTVLKKQASKSALGKTGYDSTRGKEVGQFTQTGQLIAKFGSGCDAAKAVNGTQSMISSVCLNKRPHYKGFLWKYI